MEERKSEKNFHFLLKRLFWNIAPILWLTYWKANSVESKLPKYSVKRFVKWKRKKKEGQKYRKTERQEDRKTERQRDRETERQKDRKTERQEDRKTERHRDRKTARQKDSTIGKIGGALDITSTDVV